MQAVFHTGNAADFVAELLGACESNGLSTNLPAFYSKLCFTLRFLGKNASVLSSQTETKGWSYLL